MDTIDTGQSTRYLLSILIATSIVWLKEFDSTVTGIVEPLPLRVLLGSTIDKLKERMIESCTRILIHLIDQVYRGTYTRKYDTLRINIRSIIGVIQDIRTRTTNRHLIDHTTT